MNDYERQAADFCKKWNVDIYINKIKIAKSKEGPRNIYSFSIVREDNSYTAEFTSCVQSYEKKKPSAYDILACITKSDPGSLWDFLSDFGYRETTKSLELGINLYPKVKAEFEAVTKLFPEATAMKELQNIN